MRVFCFIFVVVLIAPLAITPSLRAQDNFPRNDRRGDSPGGWGGGFQNPWRGGGNFDPSEYLKRLDTNNNGLLEPNEIGDRDRRFVQRLAQQAGLDINSPMPIDRLTAAMSSNRPDPPSQNEPFPSRDPKTEQNKSEAFGSATTAPGPTKSTSRLVPGFGEPSSLPSVPGFGTSTDTTKRDSKTRGDTADDADGGLFFASSSTPSSHASNVAQNNDAATKAISKRSSSERYPPGLPEWFIRADADGDGQVSMSEFTHEWSEAEVARFAKYDLNGDGVITPEECLQVEKSTKK